MEASRSAFSRRPSPFMALGVSVYKEAIKHALRIISTALLPVTAPSSAAKSFIQGRQEQWGRREPTTPRSLSFCVLLS